MIGGVLAGGGAVRGVVLQAGMSNCPSTPSSPSLSLFQGQTNKSSAACVCDVYGDVCIFEPLNETADNNYSKILDQLGNLMVAINVLN